MNNKNTGYTKPSLGLVDKAMDAAKLYYDHHPDEFERRYDNWPQWTQRAETARAIAVALDIPITRISVSDDPDRRYGKHPGDLITVNEPPGNDFLVWQFIPDFTAHKTGWLLLKECPQCEKLTPRVRVATLMDIGTFCVDTTARCDMRGKYPNLFPIREFYGDPAHESDCRFAAHPNES